MSRCPVVVRDAVPQDVDALLLVWTSLAGRAGDRDLGQAAAEAAASVARIAADPDQRLLVAVLDGEVVGAAHLLRAPISPLHGETAVHVAHLNVLDRCRRRGVGRALMEAAVTWAEEKETAHVLVAAAVGSRDANRFMARLGLGQIAVVRGATVTSLRAKMPVEPPAAARCGRRSSRTVGQVLAQRRSQRRSQAARPS